MNLNSLFSRRTIHSISRLNRILSWHTCSYQNAVPVTSLVATSVDSPATRLPLFHYWSPKNLLSNTFHHRFVHTSQEAISDHSQSGSEDETEEDASMNEFLSRFVWIMRGKLSEVYPECDKKTIDAMLLIIVEKVVSEMEKGGLLGSAAATSSHDFSEDLWRTVWEVSNVVIEDMEKAKRKEKMKSFLQAEKVKEMCRFAGEVGIRGDMLRELRFKWAREEMEESEFYQRLERLKKEESQEEEGETSKPMGEEGVADGGLDEEKSKVISLPKRHGKIKYKIYGLDLSEPNWVEVANKIHETGEMIWPQEPKPISGKSKLIMEKIFSLQVEEDPSPLLAEWVSLLKPSRIDWMNLLEILKEKNQCLYFKIAECILDEKSFQTNIRDYSKLIDAFAQENRLADAERILKKMTVNGTGPDTLTLNILAHMYSKAGNLGKAKESFDSLIAQGFQPDMKLYSSMIMAYVRVGQPSLGETLVREMERRYIKPSVEIYMALLRSFAQCGDYEGADRIDNTMRFAHIPPSRESCELLIEAYGRAGLVEQAEKKFDNMLKLGFKPDDRSTASMIAAYQENNLLDKALKLLLNLEKAGFEPGLATYTELVDWLGKLQLIDEVEHILDKIAQLGEAPTLRVQVSLCVMYASARYEKKALQALGVVEAKKEQLAVKDYERIIQALESGEFRSEARKINALMEAQGFVASDSLKVQRKASGQNVVAHRRPILR